MRAANSSVHLHVRAAQVSRPKRVYHATRFGLDTGQAATFGIQELVALKLLMSQTPPGPTRPTLATYVVQPDSNTPFSLDGRSETGFLLDNEL